MHLIVKPTGPLCNLDCKYCFYLKKTSLYPTTSNWKMDENVLHQTIRQAAEAHQGELHFAWQGGEPTLVGLEFFQRVVQLQERYCAGRVVHNGLQTNGLLLDDRWCQFLSQNKFLVGLSLDGPPRVHDRWRVDRGGAGSHAQALRALRRLQQHGVVFNTLTVVHAESPALETYTYLRELGCTVMQFLPLVDPGRPWCLEGPVWGDFLCTIFDEWSRHDVGRVYVQLFEVALENWLGRPASLCFFRRDCGQAVALEHNGDLYSCDHFVHTENRLGNVGRQHLHWMLSSPQQKQFGRDKSQTLPGQCRRCEVLFACHGECPKNRLLKDENGEDGLNYLCGGYLRFFRHVGPWMRAAVERITRESGLGLPKLA